MKVKGIVFVPVLVLVLAFSGIQTVAGTLEDVKGKGFLVLGVSEGIPGFSIPDSSGRWVGFDVDMGRAVTAAVLGDGEKMKFVPLASKQKIVAVSSGPRIVTASKTNSAIPKRLVILTVGSSGEY